MAEPALSMQAVPATMPAPVRRPQPLRRPGTPSRRRSRPRRRSGADPHIVGRSIRAVGHLPEAGVIRGVAKRPPLWILTLATLIIAIVFINVAAVTYSTEASRLDTEIQRLERQQVALGSTGAVAVSIPEISRRAAAAGMVTPAPGATRYLEAGPENVTAAAARLAAEGG